MDARNKSGHDEYRVRTNFEEDFILSVDEQPSDWALERAEELIADWQRSIAAHVRQMVAVLPLEPLRYAEVFSEARDDKSDRAAAITMFALFDDVLLKIYETHLNRDVPGGLDSMFNPSAFLGTSHNRLKLALALGWLSNETYHGVNLLRNIRNRFAHHVDTKSVEDQVIAGCISSFSVKAMAKHQWTGGTKRDYFIYCCLCAFQRFIFDVAIVPYARKHQVHPRSVLDEFPENLKLFLAKTEDIIHSIVLREDADTSFGSVPPS